MRDLLKKLIISYLITLPLSFAGLFAEKMWITGISLAVLIATNITIGTYFAIFYDRSFSNKPLNNAELRIWRGFEYVELMLSTDKRRICVKPDQLEIIVNSSVSAVLLSVGEKKYYDVNDIKPVKITVPSEEIKEKWIEEFEKTKKIAKKNKSAGKRKLLPRPNLVPKIIIKN